MNLLTIGDFYRQRYGRGVEIFSAAVILISYLGWVAAQITALGLVFNMLSAGAISTSTGMALGTGIVFIYTVFGGMWSVALTDFLQMIIIVVGLSLIAWFAADLAGGADKVIGYAASKDMFRFFPEASLNAWLFWLGSAITIMIGSIPQQDVFQRVMSARDADTAVRGPILGGLSYLAFAFVPIFIGVAAFVVMPEVAEKLAQEDTQKILPTLVMERMPVWLQVLFFGALLSAIMSTASATLLAPSTTFVENILKNFHTLPTSANCARCASPCSCSRCACWAIRSSWRARRSTNWWRWPTSFRWSARSGRSCAACTGSVRPPRVRSGRSSSG